MKTDYAFQWTWKQRMSECIGLAVHCDWLIAFEGVA